MPRAQRRHHASVIQQLLDAPQRFECCQALCLLLAWLAEHGIDENDALARIMRFDNSVSLRFPASQIEALATGGISDADALLPALLSGKVPRLHLTPTFMGFLGSHGVLPSHYSERIAAHQYSTRDSSALAFLNLFSSRAVAQFYQAWRKHRIYLPYEAGNPDGFSRNLLDIVGVGLGHLQQRLAASGKGIPDQFLIHYAGLLTQKPIPAINIAALVRGFFAVEACVESFVGQWMTLPPNEQSALDGRPCLLGQNTFVGERLWDRQNKIRLKLGPLSHDQFAGFLPGQPGLLALRELVQFCVGLTLDCDVTLILERGEIPAPVLGTALEGPRLGYSVWLNSKPAQEDARDASFALLGMKLRATSAA